MNTISLNKPARALALGETVFRIYLLLAGTLLASAGSAWFGARWVFAWQHPIVLALSGLACLLLVLVLGMRNSPAAMPAVFGFAILEGLSLGPMLAMYAAMSHGPLVIAEAAGVTAAIFFALSLYAWVSKRDFSFLASFLFVGLILVLIAGFANMFLHIPTLQLAIAGVSALVFSGYILVDTSRLVRGTDMPPVVIVLNLYLDILNLFLSLVQVLAALNSRD